jgi:hypothetical protein
LARAQEEVVIAAPAAPDPAITTQPIFLGQAQAPPGATIMPGDPGAEPARPRPLVHCLRRFGLACWASVNSTGCGSLKSECTFIFGSCRAFYGEPCLARDPIPPGAPGSDPRRSTGTGSGSGCGCR